MTTNRVSKYFEDDDPRAERYREVARQCGRFRVFTTQTIEELI
jgi:hypothetical protein